MSCKMKWVILALLVGSCVLTGCGPEETITTPVSAEIGQAQVKAAEMSDAAYYNSIVVVFNLDGGEYALCEGTTRIVGLDAGEQRRVELTSQMALNLSLCARNAETGNYSTVQYLGGVSPGDWLEWSPSGFGITRYTGGE